MLIRGGLCRVHRNRDTAVINSTGFCHAFVSPDAKLNFTRVVYTSWPASNCAGARGQKSRCSRTKISTRLVFQIFVSTYVLAPRWQFSALFRYSGTVTSHVVIRQNIKNNFRFRRSVKRVAMDAPFASAAGEYRGNEASTRISKKGATGRA